MNDQAVYRRNVLCGAEKSDTDRSQCRLLLESEMLNSDNRSSQQTLMYERLLYVVFETVIDGLDTVKARVFADLPEG